MAVTINTQYCPVPWCPAPWLLTLHTDLDTLRSYSGTIGPNHPQCRAVQDDFGNLIIVTEWR